MKNAAPSFASFLTKIATHKSAEALGGTSKANHFILTLPRHLRLKSKPFVTESLVWKFTQ